MSSPVNTVSVDGWDISGSDESASDMLEGLTSPDKESPEPRITRDKGRAVEEEEADPISKAASELGKKGGEAAAKAKAKAAREAKKEADDKGAEDGRKAVPEPKEGVDEGDGEEVAPPDTKKGNPRHDPTARVAQATREAAEARREAEAARREAAEAKARLEAIARERQAPPAERQPAEQRPAVQDKPRSEDYENYEEYLDARDKWNRDQWTTEATRNFQAHAQASKYAAESQAIVSGWQAALNEAAAEDPEYRTKVQPVLARIPLPSRFLQDGERPDAANWIADELMSAPSDARRLLLHFSEHPAELQRIATLSSPRAVTRELAKLAARLDAATTGPSPMREVSKAKPPVTPVTGSPLTADESPDEDDDYDSYVRKMNALEKKRRAQR